MPAGGGEATAEGDKGDQGPQPRGRSDGEGGGISERTASASTQSLPVLIHVPFPWRLPGTGLGASRSTACGTFLTALRWVLPSSFPFFFFFVTERPSDLAMVFRKNINLPITKHVHVCSTNIFILEVKKKKVPHFAGFLCLPVCPHSSRVRVFVRFLKDLFICLFCERGRADAQEGGQKEKQRDSYGDSLPAGSRLGAPSQHPEITT